VSAHLVTAVLVGLLIAAVAVASVVGLVARRRRFLEDRLILVALVAVAAAIVSGALVAIGGGRPRDGLHLLYAAGILIILPVGRFAWRRLDDRRRDWLLLAGCLVGLGLLLRLAQTG
jgi:hypothetical protein